MLANGLIRKYAKAAASRKMGWPGDEFSPISQHNHVKLEKKVGAGLVEGID
jgi:hypothetical protein